MIDLHLGAVVRLCFNALYIPYPQGQGFQRSCDTPLVSIKFPIGHYRMPSRPNDQGYPSRKWYHRE